MWLWLCSNSADFEFLFTTVAFGLVLCEKYCYGTLGLLPLKL